MQEYEERLTRLEEELLNGKAEGFDRKILSFRKELSALSAYYEQLSDMGETLQQNAAEQGDERTACFSACIQIRQGVCILPSRC